MRWKNIGINFILFVFKTFCIDFFKFKNKKIKNKRNISWVKDDVWVGGGSIIQFYNLKFLRAAKTKTIQKVFKIELKSEPIYYHITKCHSKVQIDGSSAWIIGLTSHPFTNISSVKKFSNSIFLVSFFFFL